MKETFGELKTAVIVASLRRCRLFTGLGREDIEKIAGITVIKTFNKGDYVFRQGEPSHGFYVVQKGAINVHRVNQFGREQVIQFLEMENRLPRLRWLWKRAIRRMRAPKKRLNFCLCRKTVL
ncbi:MAG: cyclic nucleotide-binding domain-containing protein [Limisphaerales bacterium]|jgi:hypothetical protein